MVRHHGKPHAPHIIPGSATADQIDVALIVLRDSEDNGETRAALELVKAADRELLVERVNTVRAVPEGLVDPMRQSLIHPAPAHRRHKTAVVFQCAGKPRFHAMTQRAIDFFRRYANCPDTLIVVVCGDEGAWQYFRHRRDVLAIRMTLLGKIRTWMKSAIYCVCEMVDADKFLFLESDTVVIRPIDDLWVAMDVADERCIFGVKPQFYEGWNPQTKELISRGANPTDLPFVTGGHRQADNGVFTFNGGTLAGTRRAMTDLLAILRSYSPFAQLACEGSGFPYSDELYTVAAINQHGYVSLLGPDWNHHSHEGMLLHDVNVQPSNEHFSPARDGRRSRILHFIGGCKDELMPRLYHNLDHFPVEP